MLKPTVGIMSSENVPWDKTFTSVVFPLFCRPTSVSSISCFQKSDLNQFTTDSTIRMNIFGRGKDERISDNQVWRLTN
jgi:hypothetical protein